MKRLGNLWQGQVNGSNQVINVVGTYGDGFPVVRIEQGQDVGKAFAIDWNTGEVIKEINYK